MFTKLIKYPLPETFLPWDLDALFVSTMVLIVTRFVDSSLLDERTKGVSQAFTLLDCMISGGNRIASYRKGELRRLDEMLGEYGGMREEEQRLLRSQHVAHGNEEGVGQTLTTTGAASVAVAGVGVNPLFASPDAGPLYSGFSDEGSGFGDDLTAEQILAVAESMDVDGTDWLSFGVFDHYQPLEVEEGGMQ